MALGIPDMKFNPLGSRGIGEIGITGASAAVANAIYHATGKRVRDLPITLDKLMGSGMAAEHLQMFQAMQGLAAENEPALLTTVVRVSGSAYRSLGARMLILPNGQRIGSVSGGCIEGEIAKKAWWWTEVGEPTCAATTLH
jgi:hypothetical protein